MIASIVISVAVYVLSVVGMWITFRKAGRWGWLSIIPLVNTIVICLIGWQKVWPIILEIVFGVVGALFLLYGGLFAVFTIYGVSSIGTTVALLLIGIVLLIIALVIYIIMLHRLSKSFGHHAGFTVGLIFVPFIMFMVLGFGKSEYLYERKRDLGRRNSGPTETTL